MYSLPCNMLQKSDFVENKTCVSWRLKMNKQIHNVDHPYWFYNHIVDIDFIKTYRIYCCPRNITTSVDFISSGIWSLSTLYLKQLRSSLWLACRLFRFMLHHICCQLQYLQCIVYGRWVYNAWRYCVGEQKYVTQNYWKTNFCQVCCGQE